MTELLQHTIFIVDICHYGGEAHNDFSKQVIHNQCNQAPIAVIEDTNGIVIFSKTERGDAKLRSVTARACSGRNGPLKDPV